MSLSKIYKLDGNALRKSEIYTTKPDAGDPDDDRFLALDALWQSSDTEYVDAMNRLQEEQERLARQTAEMVAQAKAQVDQIEKEAFDKGFNAGKEEALAEGRIKQQELAAQFNQLVQNFDEDRKRLHEHYELDILTLVKLMVDRVVFHEVTVNPLVIESCLKAAMSYVVQNSKVKINLNAADLDNIQQVTLEKPQLLEGVAQVELTEDPSISQGGCYLETGFGEIDATLETRKDEIYKALDAIFMKALTGRASREAEKAAALEEEVLVEGSPPAPSLVSGPTASAPVESVDETPVSAAEPPAQPAASPSSDAELAENAFLDDTAE